MTHGSFTAEKRNAGNGKGKHAFLRLRKAKSRTLSLALRRAFSILPGLLLGATIAALASSACVVNLTGPEEPGPDGDVTGPSADCSSGPKEPGGAPAGSAAPRLVGRFSATGEFAWSGSAMTARFTGTGISAVIELPTVPAATYDPAKDGRVFSVVIDGKASELAAVPGRARYTLAEGLDASAVHEVVVKREFEASGGLARFIGFELADGGKLEAPRVRPRRIEVIGDSISCGYGVLGADGSCVFTYGTERESLTYAAIAAETLDAELTNVCWSGKGLARNDNGDDGGKESKKTPGTTAEGMPELFGAIASRDVPRGITATGEDVPPTPIPYGFPKENEPQVVVVNLGTNDYNFGVTDGDFERRGKELVVTLRGKYPEAQLFFALSPMISNQNGPEIRTRAKATLRAIVEGSGDPRAYFMEFVEQRGARDGLGCDGHPSRRTQEIVAQQLVKAIQKKTCW